MMAEIIRTEILKIKESKSAYPNWMIETVANGGHLIILSRLSEDWRPGDDVFNAVDMDFTEARVVAIGILRAIYHEMPRTWYLAEGDPEEYLAHLLEILYESVPARQADPRDGIKNLLTLIKNYKRVLLQIGKARRESNYWKRRYKHAAQWARQNHEKLVRQKKQLRALNQKVVDLGKRFQLPDQHQLVDSVGPDSGGHGGQESI